MGRNLEDVWAVNLLSKYQTIAFQTTQESKKSQYLEYLCQQKDFSAGTKDMDIMDIEYGYAKIAI